jgi:hypothetical protein
MDLWHLTPADNMGSITRSGLDLRYARTKPARIWFVTASRIPWALLHVASRHRVPLQRIARYRVSLNLTALTRSRRGVWYATRTIPPEQILSVRLPHQRDP